MTDEVEGQVQTLEGFKVYAHGVGTVTPPKPEDDNKTEGEE